MSVKAYWDNVILKLDEVIDNYQECQEYLDKALENVKEARSILRVDNERGVIFS